MLNKKNPKHHKPSYQHDALKQVRGSTFLQTVELLGLKGPKEIGKINEARVDQLPLDTTV